MKTFAYFIKQSISFFALVRVQNVVMLSLAFILTAKYFFVPHITFKDLLTDIHFVFLLLATTLSITSGYIINSFYDFKKDLINRPEKTIIEQELAVNKKLYLYFLFNFLAVIIAGFISWRAALFFSSYIFLIWLYSHKIVHYALVSNIMSSILSIFPFFGIFLYFKKFVPFIFVLAVFLFLLLFVKDLLKDFITIKGDFAQGNKSLPIVLGEKKAKKILLWVSLLLLPVIYYLCVFDQLFLMKYYFVLFIIVYYTGLVLFIKKPSFKVYYFYNLIKLLIVLGIFSISLYNQTF